MSFVLGVVVGVVLGAGLVLLVQLSRRREQARAQSAAVPETASVAEVSRPKPDRRAKTSWREKLNRPVRVSRRGSHGQPAEVYPPTVEQPELQPVLEAVPAEPVAAPMPLPAPLTVAPPTPDLPPMAELLPMPQPTPALLPETHAELGFHVVAEPLAPAPVLEQLPPPPAPEPVMEIPVQTAPPVAHVETCPHCGISTQLFNRFCDVCQERVRSSRGAARR